jgi:hypothetical protein
MSFTAITSGEITSGKPVAATTQTKIKDNFDDHEQRLLDVEAANSAFPPIILRVNGFYGSKTGLLKTTANFSFTITGIRILIDQAGSAGDTEIDIQRKRGVGAYESVLSALPSVDFSAGNDALSSNATLNPTKTDIEPGDIIRLDLTSHQTDGNGFLVRIDYNRGA